MSELRADLAAMDTFADQTVVRRDHLDQIRNRLNSTHVPRDAFGYVPGVGGKVHDAYEELVAGCAEATEIAGDTVLSLAQSVHHAARILAQTDQANADDLSETPHPGVQ